MAKKKSSSGAMLDLWRPPQSAGEPIGCMATTYTFHPGLFDEQCLGRFLDIESEPNREDLAFLLERESRLGGVYAGVLVDHTQAGVEHSLRWDVLRVRPPSGSKQHAKLSLLGWTNHVRIIVASANLTEPGYRFNHEVAGTVEMTPLAANFELLNQAVGFLRTVLAFVPGPAEELRELQRAHSFLNRIEGMVSGWTQTRRRQTIRQQLVVTTPALGNEQPARSTLEEIFRACRGRGSSPHTVRVASPFFDVSDGGRQLTASLCKSMARNTKRKIAFCVPVIRDNNATEVPRLAAPKAIFDTPSSYQGTVTVDMLPELDGDKNLRSWHAKMMAISAGQYSALMIGSSNFTCPGMGVSPYRNVEANLLTIVDRQLNGREIGQLNSVWPAMDRVEDPQNAEWLGTRSDEDEDEQAKVSRIPAGFLSATYHGGDDRRIVLHLEPSRLPDDWHVFACGTDERELESAESWNGKGAPTTVEIGWAPARPPDILLIKWADNEAFMPINVEDIQTLPPPVQFENMTADEMLSILAAADPSAAFRAWAKRHQETDGIDPDLDSATAIDLDPLRRYDLHTTFLHRIRHRARILARLRANLERPVHGRQALEWRLRGLLGVGPLADRLAREVANAEGAIDEALLTLADFLIVLREVNYQPTYGSLTDAEFNQEFRSFLRSLAAKLRDQIKPLQDRVAVDLGQFWERVLEECHG